MRNNNLKIFTNGLLKENPTLRLVLGTCPTLAITTAAINGIGMGLAATLVLVCSNVVIAALRNVIPDKVRIPAFITVIAGFVSVVQMLVKAFTPSLDAALGIYLPLITTNCAVLGVPLLNAALSYDFLESVLFGFGNAGGAIIFGHAEITDIATGAKVVSYKINHVQGSGHVSDRLRIMLVLHELIEEFEDLR